ncbi:MAG: ATP-binding protein [Verrucomicrobiota bacterium]
MTSIRRQLLFWLLSGVVVLLIAAGACVYFAVRYVLIDKVDTELDDARRVVFNLHSRGDLAAGTFSNHFRPDSGRTPRRREDERWREFDLAEGSYFYQIRDPNTETFQKSPSLGERTIQRPETISNPRNSVSIRLDDGTLIRARVDYTGSAESSGVEIIVARDLTNIANRLNWLIAGITTVGLASAAAIAGLVTILLKRTLAPLHKLGERVEEIDASSLTARFDVDGMPVELLPIGKRLNHLMERLETSFERERRFSSDLAHELRTPIAELSAMAEAAVRFPHKVPANQHEEVLATSREMERIVESLLALARWEDGSSELEVQTIDLSQIVHECWEHYASNAAERNLDVRIDLPPDKKMETDPSLLRQILNNLFSNAADYTPLGGKVEIHANGSGLIVANTVEGLAAEDVPQLFDRFWRHDLSRTGGKHSGLGLSVAQSCAEVLSLKLSAELEDDVLRFRLG